MRARPTYAAVRCATNFSPLWSPSLTITAQVVSLSPGVAGAAGTADFAGNMTKRVARDSDAGGATPMLKSL
jgi:hypothetical protein